MNKSEKNKDLNVTELPQNEVFEKKELYQYPQPAGQGLPLKPGKKKEDTTGAGYVKEENKTSKAEGLNEENSAGDAGAFEGLEDHSK